LQLTLLRRGLSARYKDEPELSFRFRGGGERAMAVSVDAAAQPPPWNCHPAI